MDGNREGSNRSSETSHLIRTSHVLSNDYSSIEFYFLRSLRCHGNFHWLFNYLISYVRIIKTHSFFNNGNFGQNDTFGQNGKFSQNDTFGQNGEFSQNDTFGQNGKFSQNDTFGQNDKFSQNDTFGQNGKFSQNDTFGQNGKVHLGLNVSSSTHNCR